MKICTPWWWSRPARRRLKKGSAAGDSSSPYTFAVDTPHRDLLEVVVAMRREPTVQTIAAVPGRVVRRSLGPAMKPSSDTYM
jgi:hypothetical protein